MENEELAADLGLSADQIKTLKDALYEVRVKLIDLEAEMQKAALEQARLMTAGEVDVEAVMDAVQKTGDIRTAIAKERVRPLLLMRQTLTEEQMEKVKSHLRNRARGPRGADREGWDDTKRRTVREARERRGDRARRRPPRQGEDDAPEAGEGEDDAPAQDAD